MKNAILSILVALTLACSIQACPTTAQFAVFSGSNGCATQAAVQLIQTAPAIAIGLPQLIVGQRVIVRRVVRQPVKVVKTKTIIRR